MRNYGYFWLKIECRLISDRCKSSYQTTLDGVLTQQCRVNRNRSRSDAKYQSANDYMGYLYHYKKGHWKKRWFILRQGLLYKYANPKDKHPYGWYDLKDAKAISMSLQQVEQLKTVERKIKRRDCKWYVSNCVSYSKWLVDSWQEISRGFVAFVE